MLGGGTTGGPSPSPSAICPSPSPSGDDETADRAIPSSPQSYSFTNIHTYNKDMEGSGSGCMLERARIEKGRSE